MPKFLNLISQSGKQEFVDVSEFNKNPNAYGKYKIRMVDDSTGKNYDIPATMFGEAQKDGLRAWNMEKQTTKQKQVESPALQTPMSSGNLPADWGNAEMVNPKGLQPFGAPRQLSASEVKAKNNIQATLDALNRRKADGSNQDRDKRQLNAQKRVRSAQRQMQDQLDYASYTGQPLVDEFNVKNQQEIDIFTPTGNEGKGFSMLNFGVAPTVARDENNLPLLNDQGMPIKGMEADNVRAAYQRQVEQDARLRELGLHDKTIEEKIYDAKKRAAELEKKLKGGLGTQLYQGRFGNVDTERKDIRLELNNLEQEIRSLEAIRDKDDLALGGFFRSLSNTAFNPKTWDFGVSDLAAMGKMEEINSKLNRKEALTNEEISFANSQIGANSAMALEDEQMGNVYRYTKIGGESLPYMLDFILTGGYSGITKWGARQGLNAAAKFFTTRLGKAIAEKGGRNIAAATLKNTGVLIGDLASSYAMATSIQAGKTTADILKRHQGDLYVDENGDFKFEGGESMLSATARGINAAMTENLTEKFGTHLPNINVSKMFAKAGLGNASRFLNNMTSKDWYKMVTKMSNRAGIQGYPGEVIEEYLNIPLNAVIVGDNSMSDLLDPQTHGDILGGMALSIGMMGAVGLGGHLVNKSARRLRYNMLNSQLNKADAAASMSFGDNWEGDLKDAIDNTDNANMGAMIGFINNHPDLSEQQRKDALMYIDRLIKVRGFNLGLNAQMKDDTTPPIPYRNVVTNINAQSGVEPFAVISYDENGNLIERKKFMSEERANAYKENLDLQCMDNEAKNIYSSIFVKDTDGSLRQQMNDMLSNIGITLDDIKPILRKNPLKRTEDEQFAIDQMVQFASQLVYPENEVHEEKDAQDGADLAEGTPVGDQTTIDVVNEREANAISQWNQVADPDLQSSIKDLYEQGKTSNDIFDWLVANEYSDEVIAAFAELCNSGAQKDKFIEVTGQKIEEQVSQKVQQVTFAGTLNGSKNPAVIQVQDQTGVPMYVVSGNISIIPTDAGVVIQSDGLIILRDEQGNFIQRPDTQGLTLAGAYNADDYRNQLLAQTQEAVTAQIQATEYKTPEYNDSGMESQTPEAPQGNGLTAQQPATQPANTNEQQEPQPEQEPAIPTDEDGNLLYHKAPIEATINDLYNGTLDDEEIMDFVQNNINESSKEYDKINKKKPKIGTDKNAYLQAKDAWKSQVDEAKQKLDYWNSVQNYIQQQTHTTPEEVKAAQDELSGTTARLEYARQTYEGATTPEQIAGEFVRNAKIQPEDFYRETGLTATDARKQYPGMLSNDGATIARLAEQLVQYDNDNYGGMFFKGDDMEARNYIIEALKNASSRKSLGRDMTAEEQEYARVREQQREDFYQEAYGMSYSDYLAFEEQEMPNIWRRISNFAPEQYDQMVAEYYESLPEDYFTPQNEQQNGTERQQDNGLADSTTLLPQPPTDNETGGGQRQDPAAETGNGSEGDNQNEEVPGGTQGVGQTGEESSQWNTLSEEDAKLLIQNMEDSAEDYVETELSPESWNNSFDEDNSIETPIGRVKMGDNQISKFLQKKRTKEFGMVAPTLNNPDVIVEEKSEAKDGNSERQSSYIFIKTFNRNGEKIKFYASITVKKDGMEVSISSHYMNRNAVEKRLMEDNVIYIKDSLLPNSSDVHLAENPNGLPDLLPTQESNEFISEGKDTTKSPNSQENQQKTDKKSDEGQKKDEIAAEIKKDIEDFIAKSTHDVQITNYDEKEFEAQISVDGKPSNIVITPPMELGEAMHAEYRPTEGGYQELGDLLDEYNEGLEPKEQGFDGEHLAAIFSSVDAAINFETWLNQKNNPNDWENLTEEQKAATIDADTIADENAKELAKDFLRGDNTSTIAEVFYREIVGRYMDNEEAPKKKEEKKKENPLDDSIKDIQVVDAPFPKDIAEDSILSKKHNKSGKRDKTYSATIGIKDNDLYVKTKNLKTSEFVVKDALSYNANLIALRLEYAGITTDEARLLGDMVLELYNQKGLAISTAPTLKPLFPQKPKPSNVPPVGQAESDKPNAKPREDKPKTETPPATDGKSDIGKALDEFKDVMARFRKAGRTDANVSLIGLNARQIEMLGEVFRATAKLGYALIKSGTTTFENWLEAMKAQVSDIIKANSNWNDQDISELLTETWNNKYLVDGERKPLSQWAAEEALATEQKEEEPATVTHLPASPGQLMTAAQELLAAIESNDKQAIDNAKANVEKVINSLSHSDVSRFAYDKNNLVKQQNSEARKEAYKFVSKVAKKRADALIQQLNERINESYPGVRVEYNANGFWLNTTPDSKYKQIVKALDNDRRWLTETGLDASVISPINNDTFDKWVKSIGERLSEQEEQEEEQPAETPEAPTAEQSQFPYTKEELEAMSKEGMISAMWQKVFPVLCAKYKLPLGDNDVSYWFAPKMTKGYDKDSLVAACMGYMERLNDEVQPASEKQMNYIMKLAADDEKKLFKDITLTKAAAGHVIDLLKMEEDMVYNHRGNFTQEDFERIYNELEAIARLNGANIPEARSRANEITFVDNVTRSLENALETGEKPYSSITALRKAAREAGMEVGENGETDIKLQELVEDALVSVAREIMRQARIPGQRDIHKFRKETFEKIKLLYNLQPTISMRSSNRVALQQYSTPLPMAFVADMFATGKIMRMFFSALEPTAGNGMLVFGIDAKRVHVNEIDENRLENLRGQGFKEVTSQDATQPFKQDQYYDAIITNPPFGEAEAKDYDGYKISGLAQQIALNALSKMRDFGKAVIIIGGKQEFAPNGAIKNDKPFLTYLYNHYNVKGVIDMEGSLYAKQGTTFPTRMILIDGRRTGEERAKSDVYPPTIKDWLPKADSFDKLYDTVKSLMESKEKTNGTEIVRTKNESLQPDRSVTLPGNTDKRVDSRKPVQDVATAGRGHGPNRGNGKDSKRDNTELDLFGGVLGGSGELSDKPADESGTGGGSERPAGRDNGPAGEGVDNRLPVVNDVPGVQGTTTRGVGLDEEKRSLESDKLSYRPHNGAFSLESVAPAAMVEAMDKTLKRIEEEFGNIDEFVTNELGYDSVDSMHKALAAEQVDSVAMAIYNMKKGEALVIGDQTGVGKGRQMAALIRWARLQGKKPIFMTQKANLFNDIYRDLKDIGSGNLKPFIFNQSESNITEITEDEDGNEKVKVIYKRATDKEIADALKYGKIPDDCDFVLCTYSQVSTGDSVSREYEDELNKQQGDDSKKRSRSRKPKPGAKPRKDTKAVLLRALAKDNYLMLDESHTAAGESNQGFYMQTLVRDSKAVTFASATYAKRPDTMPLYALRTAMSKANIGMRNLIAAIQKGGVTLQEIMSRALSDSGQMVRRERDMTGVVTDWMTIDDPETVKRARENYDRTIQAFNAIIDFQNVYVEAFLNGQRASLAVRAGNADYVRGTDKMGISNTPFANKTYNYTKQLMLALKVDAIVDEVDRQIKAGRRPVIALDNTMGSMLDDLTVGEEVEETTFAASLIKGLQSIMQYMQDDGMGNKVRIKINPSELGAEGEAAYYQLISFIKESTKGVFISPLDEITAKLRAKGYKVGELTGRDKVVTEENGKYYVAKKGKVSKQLIQSRFNSNALDVLILNKTASTGISLHASKTFADQRQRVMILAQPLPDINDYMQMIGRIDRTGQVKRGYYINLGLPVPAEQRFLMMLSTKLKSLNANTTTSQESKDNKVEAPDMLNKYGSQVIVEYFKDHPDVYNKLNDPLNVASTEGGLSEYTPAPDDSAARKLTGYVALLSTDEQQAFYDDVVERYNTLIKYLDDTGTNDLKITSLPLGATTLARSVSSEGNDPTGDNPFAQNAYVEMVEMNVLRKPMKTSEINTAINTIAKGKEPKQAVEDIKNKYEDEYNQKLDKQERKYQAELERNKETLKKFEDKINSNEKMSEEDKKKAIEEKERALQEEANRKNDNAIGALELDHDRMIKNLGLFTVGNSYLAPDDLDSLTFALASPAIFLGYKAKDEGITPSSTLAVFATLDGRRRIEVKLSDWRKLYNINEITNQNYDAAQEVNLTNWDNKIPTNTRKTGYIMTGNILQAINDSQDENGYFTGQLISFTDSEDNIRDGILMPDKWEPTMLVNAGRPIASAKADIESGKFVRSMNGEVEIYTDRHYGMTTILLRVPKSKKLGAKYYENEDLRNAIDKREFYQKSGKFQVAIPNGKLDEVLSVLSSLGVKVPSDVVKQLNENSQQDNNSVGTKYSEDSTINDTNERFDIMKGYNAQQLKVLPRYSYINRNGVYVVGLKEYIERLRNEKNALLDEGENHRNVDVYGNSDTVSDKALQGGQELQHENDKSRRIDELLAAAEAEDKKRISHIVELRDKYGIGKDGRISRGNLSKMLRDFTYNKDYIALFDKLMDDIEHFGIDIRFDYALGKAKGMTSIFDRTVAYSFDYFARDIDDADKATVIIHELLHQELQSTIDAYNSVVFRGSLNNAQREAVNELNKIFKALKKEMPRDKNGIPFYGTKSVHEMVSELTGNEFREVLSNLQYNKKNMLQRIIDCIKRIIGLPVNEEKGNALDAASKAVQTLIENYNPSFDRNWRDKGKWILDHIEGLANKLDYSLASEVDDKAILDKLNSEPTVKVYRAMQVIDGKLYPPMAAKVGGSLVEPTKPGTWYQADEHPELIIQDGTYKDGTPKYVFKLDKGVKDATGKKATDVKAAYNPYWHTSRSPLNDQFKSAWIRPNLVTVEVEVPESELTSGYKAQYAKDAVGEVEWKSGSVSGKLAKLGNPRKVILSRYNKVVRVVPESEIADRISDMLSGTDITIPENVVTPKLRAELEKKGVSISEPEKGVNKDTQIEEALAAGLETDNSLRYRKLSDSTQKPKMSEEEKSRMTNSATSLAESINTPIKVISAEEAPEGAKNSKGYYDTRTGEVTIVLDNNTSPFDVQRTVAHEVIGHKGLRGLLGKQNYYKIMNAVYDNLPQDEKDKINEAARRNGWQMYTAIDEYLADQAENMVWDAKSASLWQNVKHYLAEALRTLGFIIKPNLKDARYWLWLSKNQLKRSDVMSSIERNALLAKLDKLGLPEQKVEEQDHLGEPKYAFRNGNYVDSATYDAIEQNLKNNSFYWKEAFIDYMQAYQVFQNEMAKGLENGLMDNQNALIGENALTSAIEQQQSDYMRMQLKPLQDIIKKLQPEFGKGEEGIRNIENYLMMKHGLERNRVLFMRDWFTSEASRKIENDGQLTPEGQLIYTSMYQSIWYEYTNGNIDEAERDKQLKIALNEAHLQYLNDVMSDFNSIKNIELQAYDWGIRSLAEAYKNIDDFINQHANFEADKQDKSGLTALKEYFSGNNYEDEAIIDQVQSYDDMIGSDMADKLMEAVQAVSQFALDEDYKNGLVTKEGYNRAKNMFRYYIPLRGFDETTMEDVYEYMTYSKGTGAKSLVHAKGRSSRAGSPLATAANMALNAIARGLRNQNKQRAYRLVNTWLKDNPTSVPPAIVADLWVGLDANGNDTVFTPDITDDMTAEEIRNEIEKFKDKMRIMEELGKASKVRSEASFRHRFSSDNHKYEHIVPLMINGRAKMIVFNGNPRPAQALRGDLAPTVNKEFGLDKIMGKINRVMAGAFTSYNPTFMATNLLRDTGFANNNIAVKEGGEYYAKFLKNQAALLTKNIGKYAKLKWDYDKGIAPRNEMEQYFYEFMKNGGKTGFVNQQDIAKLEKLLAENNQNFSALNAGTVIAKYTVNAIKAANDRIENINRFAVYMTSRQMGRSVMRSIYDAKEVSVNFNRKGAAGNTGRTPNATANMKLAANLASFTRGAYLFFNAGVQSLNLLSKNTKGHPIKSAAYIVGIPMLLGGFVIPMLNQIIAEAAGDGDDDPYANLPEWTRRNNFCFYLGKGTFLKIPLPIELRAFFGLGDIAAGYLVNEHLKSEKNVALDVASQLTQILPVDFLGEGGSVTAALTPDAMKPMIQIATNTDWTGKPIYKDSEWNKYEPEYTKAFKNEFEPFINLSKFINEAAGGSDHVRSDIEGEWNNPAIWHAIIQGYGGGAVMDVVRVGSLSRRLATMDSKGLTTKEVPIVKAIFETPSEKTQYYRMLNKFYSYQEKNEKFKHDLKALSESASPLDHAKFLRHTDQNKPSREMIIWSRFRDYDKVNKYINKVLENPNLSEADREALEQQAVRLKVDLVKILDQIED